MAQKREIKVFIASPGDLAVERHYFFKVIDDLNKGFGDGNGTIFTPLGIEQIPATTGIRSQDAINQQVDDCDVFILVMHRRWGQPAPDSPYDSYTEEEYRIAYKRFELAKKPVIFVFFKKVDPESEADPGEQLMKVLEFRRQLEDTRMVLYRIFDNENTFSSELDRHLRLYAKDELPKTEEQLLPINLTNHETQQITEARKHAEQMAKEAELSNNRNEQLREELIAIQLEMAEDAAKFAIEGKVEHARQKFTKLVSDTIDTKYSY